MNKGKKLVQGGIIDAEFSVEKTAEADGIEKQAVNENPQCEIIVGMSQDGDIYYRIQGTNQNLVLLEGLQQYLGRVIDGLWNQRVGQ